MLGDALGATGILLQQALKLVRIVHENPPAFRSFRSFLMFLLVSALTLAALALTHVFGGRLHVLDVVPRSRWLSFAGGISVAYVFLHLLPELAERQEAVAAAVGSARGFLEDHVYLVALLGLAVFYGLERAVKTSQRVRRECDGDDRSSAGVFWLHIASFAVYNALIGYLLVRREARDLTGLVLFAIAMILHFVVNDFGLRKDHQDTYVHVGRWVLAAAVVVGWVVGLLFELPEAALGMSFAFLAGGVVLNVLKEELPEERASHFGAFALGTALYAVLLLVG